MSLGIIPFLLLFIPILEIVVFILVGGQIGVVATLAMILFTAILGSILLRIQGFSIVNRIREQTERGELPGRELGNGAMILAAGILLLTPGFVTDTLGSPAVCPTGQGYYLVSPCLQNNSSWTWRISRAKTTQQYG